MSLIRSSFTITRECEQIEIPDDGAFRRFAPGLDMTMTFTIDRVTVVLHGPRDIPGGYNAYLGLALRVAMMSQNNLMQSMNSAHAIEGDQTEWKIGNVSEDERSTSREVRVYLAKWDRPAPPEPLVVYKKRKKKRKRIGTVDSWIAGGITVDVEGDKPQPGTKVYIVRDTP